MTRRAVILACLWPVAATAQANCAPHDMVMERLADGFGEALQAVALDASGRMVEVWANPETGSWTFTVTRPGGPTCLVASGQSFELLAETVIPGDPA